MMKTLDTLFSGNKNNVNKKILIRVDINAPITKGIITDDTRIRHILPTLTQLLHHNYAVILMAHRGRPNGQYNADESLGPIAKYLGNLLGKNIKLSKDVIGEDTQQLAKNLKGGEIMMLENIRFEGGEEQNDPKFAKKLAQLADIYVNDAFSVSHRAHASTHAITKYLPAYVGRGMQAETDALDKALAHPTRPVAAVIGGAKVSTKITLLENLLNKVDVLVIGGGMANTFLAARGYNVGKSLCEYDFVETAKKIMAKALETGKQIILPVDVVVTKAFEQNAPHRICNPADIEADEMVLDAGPGTVTLLKQTFASMKTIVWNGPLGAFEMMPFDRATVETARIVAELTQKGIVTSIAGGGDTVSALNHAGISEKFTYVSTAGGAFLEWMEGKPLPALEALIDQEEVI